MTIGQHNDIFLYVSHSCGAKIIIDSDKNFVLNKKYQFCLKLISKNLNFTLN
jgi:hypothetical protein